MSGNFKFYRATTPTVPGQTFLWFEHRRAIYLL